MIPARLPLRYRLAHRWALSPRLRHTCLAIGVVAVVALLTAFAPAAELVEETRAARDLEAALTRESKLHRELAEFRAAHERLLAAHQVECVAVVAGDLRLAQRAARALGELR